MKPIVVIFNNKIYEFSNINNAETFAAVWDGTIYRREDWYQEKCKQVDMLIDMDT